jgi:4-oxalocrotonate tautomerase
MPAVTIQQDPRDVELKRELIKRITDAFVETYQIPAATVMVLIEETSTDSFGVGGRLAADK